MNPMPRSSRTLATGPRTCLPTWMAETVSKRRRSCHLRVERRDLRGALRPRCARRAAPPAPAPPAGDLAVVSPAPRAPARAGPQPRSARRAQAHDLLPRTAPPPPTGSRQAPSATGGRPPHRRAPGRPPAARRHGYARRPAGPLACRPRPQRAAEDARSQAAAPGEGSPPQSVHLRWPRRHAARVQPALPRN
jgi:hypothetical protein